MSSAGYDRPAGYRIGRVLGDTFGVLGRNFGLCFALTVIFSGIPTFAYQLWMGNKIDAAVLAAETDPSQAFAFDAASVTGGLVAFVIYMVLASILNAALVRATIEDLNGQNPTFADTLGTALAVLLPIIGLSILAYIGMVVGFMLLIIPGIYLLVRWSASTPVLVHERLGVLASLKRSSELTKGSRWRIFGLLLILIVVVWILQVVLGLLALVITPLLGTVLATALVAVLSAVSTVILSIAVAVSYVELRYVKEGTDVKELAEIFA
jgi:hypothetical protein